MGYGIAVDSSGNVYITGETGSIDFPTGATPYDATLTGTSDAFVTKINASGDDILFSTYLGGSYADHGRGIAVDGTGNAYVMGHTFSYDFPMQNPYQPTKAGHYDAFVAKLSDDGTSLIYSTFLGGSELDWGSVIAVDGNGNAYVMGITNSTDFPTQNPYQAAKADYQDTFVAKLSDDGSSLIYSTYLGGSYYEYGNGIAVDNSGNVYVSGGTNSWNFPTQNPIQAYNAGSEDAFVSKLSDDGGSLIYSTYLGGHSDDKGQGIAVDGTGNAYVTGITASDDFPRTAGAFQENLLGVYDAFVAKLSANGSSLAYSTYLGGSSDEWGWGIAVDGTGNAYVTGFTCRLSHAESHSVCLRRQRRRFRCQAQ
jgi:hypothetical protein